jgi:hypothetical protein
VANVGFWSNHFVGLLLAFRGLTGIGDGEVQNGDAPASPDRDVFSPVKLLVGRKMIPVSSPNRGNPRRGSGIEAPLPSLAARHGRGATTG